MARQKQSEYRHQLREKQKARRYYQVLEKQFRNYYDKASRQPGVTGENLLRLLETPARQRARAARLRGLEASGPPARRHGHFLVNGRRVNVPSYQVKPGEVISAQGRARARRR